jgi:hypothetical protein
MTFFSHEQLYVAFSHAKAPANVKVQLPDSVHGRIGLMRNVMYKKPSFEAACISYVHYVQLFKIECFFEINMVYRNQGTL